MKTNNIRRAVKRITKAPELISTKYANDCILIPSLIALEETQDSSSVKKVKRYFCLEKTESCLLSNKENEDSNVECTKDLFVTPLAISKISHLTSTITSRLDTDCTRRSDKSLVEEKVPAKGSRRGKVARISNRPNHKAMKKNEDGEKLYKSYLILTDRKTKRSEKFKLYKDSEIGFERDLQDTIKEAVIFFIILEF